MASSPLLCVLGGGVYVNFRASVSGLGFDLTRFSCITFVFVFVSARGDRSQLIALCNQCGRMCYIAAVCYFLPDFSAI